MKRFAFKTVVAVILVSAFLLVTLSYVRNSQRNTQFKAAQAGFRTMLQVQAMALNDGFFSWSELRTKVEKADLISTRALLEEVYDLYPYIENIDVRPGTPPDGAYGVASTVSSLSLTFGVKDDFGNSPLPGWVGEAEVNVQKLLDSLQTDRRIVVAPVKGRDLVYSIRADFVDPLLDWLDYLFIILLTMATGYAVSVWLWRRNVTFYETRGLESIIFLFEQTERVSANHSRRVAALTMFLGQKMGYRGRRLRDLYTAGLLHDIGKISVPSNILLKEGPLTPQEQQIVATHPIISARILKNFKELTHLSGIVLHHHERIDGSGYPEGLEGSAIPEEARIIAVVDVFEALVGDRPYRDPLTTEEAFATLRDMPIDQSIVEILVAHFGEFKSFQTPKWALAYHHGLEKV
ncbi:HD-GYP domain-containing protein [bacterium]|nr:HD-GYP domain-containing protein [bacterium]